ncbi:hypothetical protein SAMN05216345_101214 [Cupriavidus sp. YR651]|uniref:hypothetical protein n=1 Tax=Cupriavidus sp. YR651 TaxID=1855315 RepID=UPI00088619F2|nr:hypothetical protein [Cupriavidus sp. YR651]SDC02263.1 hypothetical protein SAMN05216345_101214 [Cupriavidus sp. YR651]
MIKLHRIPARVIAIGAAAVSPLPLIVWLYYFWETPISDNPGQWNNFGTFIGGTISPIMAVAALAGLIWTIQQERATTDEGLYLEMANRCWERAFDSLNSNGEPRHDRLAWLTCARLLLAADEVSTRLDSDSSSHTLLAAEKAHWRLQFYGLLRLGSAAPAPLARGYFERDASPYGSPIEPRSVQVIFDFARWPEGQVDQIDGVTLYSLDKIDVLPPSMLGAREYLRSSAEAKARRET